MFKAVLNDPKDDGKVELKKKIIRGGSVTQRIANWTSSDGKNNNRNKTLTLGAIIT